MKIKTTNTKPLTPGLLRKMDAYWRATNCKYGEDMPEVRNGKWRAK